MLRQSRHGGYLSYNNFADIKASAPKIVPAARFVVWNCDDLNDHGILRYGDAVWLQVNVYCCCCECCVTVFICLTSSFAV